VSQAAIPPRLADLVDAKLLCKLQLLGLPVLPGPILVSLLRM
jgi:hypothetical protein